MRKISVFGLSASRGSGAAGIATSGAKEAKAAIKPKTGPRGRERTKGNYRTVGR